MMHGVLIFYAPTVSQGSRGNYPWGLNAEMALGFPRKFRAHRQYADFARKTTCRFISGIHPFCILLCFRHVPGIYYVPTTVFPDEVWSSHFAMPQTAVCQTVGETSLWVLTPRRRGGLSASFGPEAKRRLPPEGDLPFSEIRTFTLTMF